MDDKTTTTTSAPLSSDPALNPANQHVHEHFNHAGAAARDTSDIVYTTGTTVDPSNVPTQVHKGSISSTTSKTKGEAINPVAGNGSTPPDYSDHEKAEAGVLQTGTAHSGDGDLHKRGLKARLGRHYPMFRIGVHAFIVMLFTGWWIASLVLHRNDRNWLIPFLVWLGIMLRVLFWYVPIKYVSGPIRWVWQRTAVPVSNAVPARFRTLAGAGVTIAAILVGAFVSPEVADNDRESRAMSLLGLACLIFFFWLTSRHRSRINWRSVIVGMLAQYIIGLFVLRTDAGYDIFKFIADRAVDLLGFAKEGVAFLFDADTANTGNFFWGVIPAIVFFIALVQVLYYLNFIQWFVRKFATFVFWAMGVSGAEAVVAAATPFIGQGESAMLVRPFVPHMTNAELHQIMTCGFATISGSVLVGYIGFGLNAQVLVSSCIMSIPASLALSKLRYPETEETLTAGRVVIPDDDEHKAENALHAFANGTWLGLKIGATIAASLLCIIAAVGLINGLLSWWGRYLNINDPLTLQLILGYLLFPVAALLGVQRDKDVILKTSRLIAEKVITNEFNAFLQLTDEGYRTGLSPRTILISTYSVCGFGNIGSLGIQIGILGQLAPSRSADVSRVAVSALITGVFATLSSATVAGLVATDQLANFAAAS
jgi:CNT family concentrative nucleoside transporter